MIMSHARIQHIQDRINTYEGSHGDHTPFRAEFKVKPPIFTGNAWIFLDGIIQHLCTREALGEDFYDIPTNHLFDFDSMNLPLRRTMDVYHASVGIYRAPKLRTSRIYKRFEDYFIENHPELLHKSYNIGSGHYKNHMITYPLIVTDTVQFYGCGDTAEVRRLLSHLTHLGKKTGIGGGKILKLSVEETEADHSFYHDDYGVMRPIPTRLKTPIPVEAGQVIMRMAYKPPYWDKRNIDLCIAPKNQLVGEAL